MDVTGFDTAQLTAEGEPVWVARAVGLVLPRGAEVDRRYLWVKLNRSGDPELGFALVATSDRLIGMTAHPGRDFASVRGPAKVVAVRYKRIRSVETSYDVRIIRGGRGEAHLTKIVIDLEVPLGDLGGTIELPAEREDYGDRQRARDRAKAIADLISARL